MAYKEKHWAAALLGSGAVLTRSPGILLLGGYLGSWLMIHGSLREKIKLYFPYLLMPLVLLLLFGFYGIQYGNFWAYFTKSSELHPILFPPFLIFADAQRWISDMWREDIIYLYLFYGVGVALIREKKVKLFGLIYGLTLLFVAHRDLGRYALPIAPLAILGFAPLLEKIPRKIWMFLVILLIPIYLLGWQFILKNIQPISDWGALL